MVRPIRIANCSGAIPDPGYQMYRQATGGPVDAVTGDYLAEMNIGSNAKAYRQGKHNGWEPSCEDGLLQTISVASEKKIKLVVNGGALNPGGLARLVAKEVQSKGLNLKVAYVSGDDVFDKVGKFINDTSHADHLDSANPHVKIPQYAIDFLNDPNREVVSANGYTGARGIVAALNAGADVIVCGRVADASPVIGLAVWWHGWNHDQDFDRLAGALVSGHLIECSSYITGANFSDFERYPMEKLMDVGLPIAEINDDGSVVITKHEAHNGIVNADTCKCQLLYELQGNIYLNSDVKADLSGIKVEDVGKNRVLIHGARGFPPPPTTKLAIFYVGGYQAEITFNATGTPRNVRSKFKLMKAQAEKGLKDQGVYDKFDLIDFQFYAAPELDPYTQKAGTSYMRIFVQGKSPKVVGMFIPSIRNYFMQHFSGFHGTGDFRTCIPKEYVAFYPAIAPQTEFKEQVHLIEGDGEKVIDVSAVQNTEPLAPREDYETAKPVSLTQFGPTVRAPVETVILGRSGDKGGNCNLGLFVHQDDEYEWLKSYFTKDLLKKLIGGDWKDEYYIERVEFPHIRAVHFVVYGILGRGVSSSPLLDSLGKAFCDYIRSKYIEVPRKFVERYPSYEELKMIKSSL
uniref:ARAD1A05412p n=1 Tax=Blastobotrys adeninivorans TaxID=409370 RepID=A0A060SX23_BLAAD